MIDLKGVEHLQFRTDRSRNMQICRVNPAWPDRCWVHRVVKSTPGQHVRFANSGKAVRFTTEEGTATYKVAGYDAFKGIYLLKLEEAA